MSTCSPRRNNWQMCRVSLPLFFGLQPTSVRSRLAQDAIHCTCCPCHLIHVLGDRAAPHKEIILLWFQLSLAARHPDISPQTPRKSVPSEAGVSSIESSPSNEVLSYAGEPDGDNDDQDHCQACCVFNHHTALSPESSVMKAGTGIKILPNQPKSQVCINPGGGGEPRPHTTKHISATTNLPHCFNKMKKVELVFLFLVWSGSQHVLWTNSHWCRSCQKKKKKKNGWPLLHIPGSFTSNRFISGTPLKFNTQLPLKPFMANATQHKFGEQGRPWNADRCVWCSIAFERECTSHLHC